MLDLSSKGVADRVRDQLSKIQQIAKASGAVGLSYAVVHHGEPICVQHMGYRDAEAQLQPDQDTRYNINSLSKATVAALVGIEVQRGKLAWNTRIKDVLPAFGHDDAIIKENTTITDLLSHRTGITGNDDRWIGSDNNIINERKNILKILSSMSRITEFRSGWTYCNLGYEIITLILEKINEQPLCVLLQERLFRPLGMTRTSTSWNTPPEDGNSTKAYSPLQDGTPVQIQRPQLGQGSLGEGAGGVKSTITDMIRWVQTWLQSIDDPAASQFGTSFYSPLKQVPWLTSHHGTMYVPSAREQGYGCGWARVQLPGPLGYFSYNFLVPRPVVGQGATSQPVLYHHGCMVGSRSVICMLPESKSAIVVLGNTTGMCDYADYIGQLLVETIIDAPKRNDYVALAKEPARQTYGWLDQVQRDLDRRRVSGSKPRALSAYVGTYWTVQQDFRIDVIERNGELLWSSQGQTDLAPLRYYQDDSFAWNLTHNEVARRGRVFLPYEWHYYLFHFQVDKDSERVTALKWAWDEWLPESPTTFYKEENGKTSDEETWVFVDNE